MKTIGFFIMATLIFQLSFSQQDSAHQKNTLKFSVDYITNNVYLGRKDSLHVPYITPGLRFTTPSGFFASADASFLTTESRFDLYTLEAGYEFSKNKFDVALSATQFFYNSASVNVKAELGSSIAGYIGYYSPFIKPSISGYISLGSNKPDYTTSLGLEHSFETTNEAFSFTPAVYVNAGTQNYYDSYYQNRKYGKGRRGRTVMITAEALDASKFKVMDYEWIATVEYKVKNFSFYAEPVYVIPVNPNKVAITTKPPLAPATTKIITEKLSNSFYGSIGVAYTFPLHKHS